MRDVFFSHEQAGRLHVDPGAHDRAAFFREIFGKSNGDIKIENAADMCLYILEKKLVALVPGCAFGDPNCIRFSYATSNDILIEAIKRFKSALAELS